LSLFKAAGVQGRQDVEFKSDGLLLLAMPVL